MSKPGATLVSILVPAYNEEENVERAYRAIVDIFDTLPHHDCEIIFTDNHSTDRTFELLRDLATQDPRVRVIRFARNYGYQRSVLTAYQHARGACAIQMDCDLQDPPELIPQMLELWRQGNQVVYGVRRSLTDGPATRAARRWYYYIVNALSEDDLPLNAGEFRLVDARLLAELRNVRDTTPYVRGLISAMGFAQVGFEYDRRARVAGESKFPLRKMISLAMDGVLNHSLVPLRVASAVGLTIGFITLAAILVYLAGRLIFGAQWPAGFATTTVLLLMGITLNAIFLGIIGEYLGRIFLQAKARMPIIEAQLNMSGPFPVEAPQAAPPPVSRLREAE